MKTKSSRKITVLGESDKAFLKVLQKHFEEKKKANFRYSIRAFARHLDLDQSLLSKVLRGEKVLSGEGQSRCLKALKIPSHVVKTPAVKKKFHPLDEDMFEVLSDWHHFAIMEFITLKNVEVTPQSIAKRFGITTDQGKEYLQRLINLKFVEKNSDGRFALINPNNTCYHPTRTSQAKKMLQKSLLEESIRSIETVPFELRDHSAVTIAINKSQMPEFKEILQDVRRKLSVLLQKNEDFDEVYQLNISLFPLTRIEGPQ